MPFVHLEREIWDLRDEAGTEIGPDVPERGSWLTGRGAVGQLRPWVEQSLADPGTLAAAARLLLDLHFTPGLANLICDEVGLDLAVLELAASPAVAAARRSPEFAEKVLRAYAYQCAMCGFDGSLGRNPVGLEAAHARWHSQDGPDVVANGLSLCALHHALLDLGVLGTDGGSAHPGVQPVCGPQRRGTAGRGRPLRPAAARTPAGPARYRA